MKSEARFASLSISLKTWTNRTFVSPRFLFVVLALTILCAVTSSGSAAEVEPAASYIRVNQVGYETGTASRAYLMAPEPLGHATFQIRDEDEKRVFVGAVGSELGTWGSFFVYPIDFVLSKAGKFTITTGEEQEARSPSFEIAAPRDLYATALHNALSYYQNSRDGMDFIPSALRTAPSHLTDKAAKVYLPPIYDANDTLVSDLKPTGKIIDASGGWWDAGDYVKFVETHSYTVALMLIGVRDFPVHVGREGRDADFSDEARFGLDWLGKMWDDRTRTLYYQVGLGNGNNNDILADHDIWRLPQADDTYAGKDPTYKYVRHRPVLRAGPSGAKISPNLAGRTAAAFALGAQIYEDSDPEFSRECLRIARHIFDLADTAPRTLLTVAPFDYYPETEWRDDMELGATEIYLAMKGSHFEDEEQSHSPGHYLKAASHWAHEYIHGADNANAIDTLNLYDVSGLAHYELYRAMDQTDQMSDDEEDEDQLESSRKDLLDDMKKHLDGAIAQSKTDPFEYGTVWNVSDTATHGAGLSVVAKEYATLTGSREYDRYSRRWAANILGANAWGSSFIVGDGSVFPNCMQHQVANLAASLDGSEPRLDGALVEGPNSAGATGLVDGMRTCPADGRDRFAAFNGNGSVFVDDVQSYATVEPAIDLTAASILMFASRAAAIPEVISGDSEGR